MGTGRLKLKTKGLDVPTLVHASGPSMRLLGLSPIAPLFTEFAYKKALLWRGAELGRGNLFE